MSYHYFERSRVHADNLLHFLTFGATAAEQVIVAVAGETSLSLPRIPNVRYVRVRNHDYDYGGHAHVVRHEFDADRFDLFAFINSSARGPFLPPWYDGAWPAPFAARLTRDVKLVGPTLNVLVPDRSHSRAFARRHGGEPPYTHLQSMFFMTDREGLGFLKAEGFFDRDLGNDRSRVLTDYEILLSQLFLRRGWRVRGLLPEYDALDLTKPHVNPNPTALTGDPSYRDAYFGRSLHPYEAIFVKSNRDLHPPFMLDLLTHSMACASGLPAEGLFLKPDATAAMAAAAEWRSRRARLARTLRGFAYRLRWR